MRGSAALRAVLAPGGVLAGPWVSNELWRRARAVPSLDLRFAENKSLVDSVSGQNLITFTRASTGTFVDSDGVIRSAGNNVARFEHHPTTGECLGLLVEEQRVQLLQLTDTLATQTKTVAAAAHTLSFYGTGTVVLSGVHSATVVGTGAYPARTTLTFTPTAGSLTLTVTGTVQFGQLEAGAFATSYIPNAGTGQVTRSADVASITGANFSSWYRQDEGTIALDFSLPTTAGNTAIASFSQAAAPTTNRHSIRQGSTIATTAGSQVANFTNQTTAINTRSRIAYGYKADDFFQILNGTTSASDTSGAVPASIDQLEIGKVEGFSLYSNGPFRRLTYWPRRLSNNVLQSITL